MRPRRLSLADRVGNHCTRLHLSWGSLCAVPRSHRLLDLNWLGMAFVRLTDVSVTFPVYGTSHRSLRTRIMAMSTGGRIGRDASNHVYVKLFKTSPSAWTGRSGRAYRL